MVNGPDLSNKQLTIPD